MTLVVVVYTAASLVIAGRRRRHIRDLKFASPKLGLGEVIFFGLFVALLWPLLAAATIVDAWGAQK